MRVPITLFKLGVFLLVLLRLGVPHGYMPQVSGSVVSLQTLISSSVSFPAISFVSCPHAMGGVEVVDTKSHNHTHKHHSPDDGNDNHKDGPNIFCLSQGFGWANILNLATFIYCSVLQCRCWSELFSGFTLKLKNQFWGTLVNARAPPTRL